MSYQDLFLTSEPLVTNIVEGQKPVAKIFGVPFDATATFRSGTRFGPNAIRSAFMNIEIYSHRLNVDLERLSVTDLGNLRYTSSIEEMLNSVEKICGELIAEKTTFAILGGEHSISLASCRALPSDVAIAVFDAHLDLRDQYGDMKLNHATWLRRLCETRGADNILHIGARASSRDEWKHAEDMGLSIVSSDTIHVSDGSKRLLSDFLNDFQRLYVSIDLDVLDPAYAPGVGNPESGGLSMHDLLEFLYETKGIDLVGFDITELCPPFDNGATAVAAARCLSELTCLATLSKTKVKKGTS